MDSGENFTRKSERYLTPLEDLKGNLDFKAQKLAEVFDMILKDAPGYYGVVPIGSAARGYSVQASDIDMIVFRDRKSNGTDQELQKFVTEVHDKVVKNSPSGPEMQYLNGEFDADMVREFVDDTIKTFAYLRKTYFWLYCFSPMAIGEGIDEMRKQIKTVIRTYPEAEQKNIIRTMAYEIAYQEQLSRAKILRRLEFMTAQELQQLEDKRRLLWERQINEVLQYSE